MPWARLTTLPEILRNRLILVDLNNSLWLEIALEKAKSQGFDLSGSVMASDAFFPFSDNVEKAAENGITAIIQPGGSQNDEEVISKVDELNLSMIFTGQRHFRH